MRINTRVRNLVIVIILVVAFGGGLIAASRDSKNQIALKAVQDATTHANSDPASVPALTQQTLPITGTKIHVKFFSDGVNLGPSVIPSDNAPSLLSPSTSLDFATQLSTAAHKPVTKCEQPGKTSTTAFISKEFGKDVPVCAIQDSKTGLIVYLISQETGPDGNIYVTFVRGATGRDLKPFYGALKPVFDSITMDY